MSRTCSGKLPTIFAQISYSYTSTVTFFCFLHLFIRNICSTYFARRLTGFPHFDLIPHAHPRQVRRIRRRSQENDRRRRNGRSGTRSGGGGRGGSRGGRGNDRECTSWQRGWNHAPRQAPEGGRSRPERRRHRFPTARGSGSRRRRTAAAIFGAGERTHGSAGATCYFDGTNACASASRAPADRRPRGIRAVNISPVA